MLLAEAQGVVRIAAEQARLGGSRHAEHRRQRFIGRDVIRRRRGKKQYRANNFGLAEKYFRHAAELHPRDAEAWLGLAASYDRLRRFDLADRAYNQAIGILGPTTEILNNQGYSYMLRGDYKHAREKLAAAQRRDPGNKYVQNNLQLLEDSYRKGKAIE